MYGGGVDNPLMNMPGMLPEYGMTTPGQIGEGVGNIWEGSNIPIGSRSAFGGEGGEGGDYQFPFPEQWNQAGNIYSQLAGMGGWQSPLQQMYSSGMPVDVSGLGEHYRTVGSTMMEDFTKQAAEQAGLGGLRWSTPLTGQIAEQGRRLGENFGLSMAQADIAAQEAARQRMMGGIGMGMGGQMGALQGLTGLGREYMYGPMNISQGMMGLGNQMQSQQMNPYLPYAVGMAGQGQYVPQQYQPSMFSQGLNITSALIPWLMQGQSGGNFGGPITGGPPNTGFVGRGFRGNE
jgi:hypothetical protein